MPLLIGLGRILHFGLLVGYNVLIVLGTLPPKRFEFFGMFTFGKLVLFPLLFASIFSSFVTLLMSTLPGFFGVVRLRLVLLVLIFLLEVLPSRVPVAMLVEALCPSILCGRVVGMLGGRCHDRIYHVDGSDEFDVTHFGFFLNSSLAPVLRFRRCFVSVCNVLKGIKQHGFSEARVSALEHRWRAIVRLGPTGLVASLEPWTHWIPPDLHGFYKWAMDTLALLNEFVLKVVRHRQTSRSIAWTNWIREDLASRPYKWLRPEFVSLAPYLVCRPRDSPNGSGILVQPALIDAHFRKAWMPYFRREGHPVVTVHAFLEFVGDHLPQEPFLDLPVLTGEDLYEAAMANKSTAAGLDGWAWNEIKALSLSWFVGLALVLRQVEAVGQWPQGLLDAYIAMIPKAEGDSTPPGQRPLCVLPVLYRLWASVRLAHLKNWFSSWVPDSVFSAGQRCFVG